MSVLRRLSARILILLLLAGAAPLSANQPEAATGLVPVELGPANGARITTTYGGPLDLQVWVRFDEPITLLDPNALTISGTQFGSSPTVTPPGATPNNTLVYRVTVVEEDTYLVTLPANSVRGTVSGQTNPTISWEFTYDHLPGRPRTLYGRVSYDQVTLHWEPNTERDLAGYIILYLGPSKRAEIATVPAETTSYTTPFMGNYGIVAIDQAGNRSPTATFEIDRGPRVDLTYEEAHPPTIRMNVWNGKVKQSDLITLTAENPDNQPASFTVRVEVIGVVNKREEILLILPAPLAEGTYTVTVPEGTLESETGLNDTHSRTFRVDHLPPSPPPALRAESGDGEVRLHWHASPDQDVQAYAVYRTVPGQEPKQLPIIPSDSLTYLDTLANGQTATYHVVAIDLNWNRSVPSVSATGSPDAGLPMVRYLDMYDHWARSQVASAWKQGWIWDGNHANFRPDEPIDRLTLAVWIARAFKLPPGRSPDLKDLQLIRQEDLALLLDTVGAGIMVGRGDGTFAPNDPVTRAEMAVVLARALKLSGAPSRALAFTDAAEIPPWATESIGWITSLGMIRGYEDGTFRPGKQTSRAEAVVLILRALRP